MGESFTDSINERCYVSVPDKTVPWDTVAAIRSSDSRRTVFEGLADNPRYAAELAKEEGLSRNTVSKHIHWLKGEDLIECLTPDRPHCRIYGLTETGKAVYDSL